MAIGDLVAYVAITSVNHGTDLFITSTPSRYICDHLASDSSNYYKQAVNSLRLIDVYMRRWTMATLVQIMASRLVGAQPLSKPMLEYCELNPHENVSVKCSKFIHFHLRKCTVDNFVCEMAAIVSRPQCVKPMNMHTVRILSCFVMVMIFHTHIRRCTLSFMSTLSLHTSHSDGLTYSQGCFTGVGMVITLCCYAMRSTRPLDGSQ